MGWEWSLLLDHVDLPHPHVPERGLCKARRQVATNLAAIAPAGCDRLILTPEKHNCRGRRTRACTPWPLFRFREVEPAHRIGRPTTQKGQATMIR